MCNDNSVTLLAMWKVQLHASGENRTITLCNVCANALSIGGEQVVRNALTALINLTSHFEIFRNNLCGRHARGDILMSRLLALVAADSGFTPPTGTKTLKNQGRLALMLLVNATMCTQGAEQLLQSMTEATDKTKSGSAPSLDMMLQLLNAKTTGTQDKFEHCGHVLANVTQIEVFFTDMECLAHFCILVCPSLRLSLSLSTSVYARSPGHGTVAKHLHTYRTHRTSNRTRHHATTILISRIQRRDMMSHHIRHAEHGSEARTNSVLLFGAPSLRSVMGG